MRFADVLSRCVLGIPGHLGSMDDVHRLQQVMVANAPVMRTFSRIVVATNYGPHDGPALRRAHSELWRQRFPTAVLLDSPLNRGHSIGTADLDNMLFDWCRAHDADWLCKAANDVTLSNHVLDIDVQPAQFYFINGVSYDAIVQRDLDLTPFRDGYFFPQDTFWVLAVGNMDILFDKEFLDASWRVVSALPDYSGRIWEHSPGWSCEFLLAQAVRRGGLTTCSLLTPDQWQQVLRLTVERGLADCSLKGIEVNGICHVQGLSDISERLAILR